MFSLILQVPFTCDKNCAFKSPRNHQLKNEHNNQAFLSFRNSKDSRPQASHVKLVF